MLKRLVMSLLLSPLRWLIYLPAHRLLRAFLTRHGELALHSSWISPWLKVYTCVGLLCVHCVLLFKHLFFLHKHLLLVLKYKHLASHSLRPVVEFILILSEVWHTHRLPLVSSRGAELLHDRIAEVHFPQINFEVVVPASHATLIIVVFELLLQ